MSEYATFTGRVSDDELCRILSSATLGIDPDPKNPWSDKSTMNKVIEYMYFGLPVVAYDLHETRVSAGAAGLYAAPNEELALAAAINMLLDDPARRAAMADDRRHRGFATCWPGNHSVASLLAAYDRAWYGPAGHGRPRRAPAGEADPVFDMP